MALKLKNLSYSDVTIFEKSGRVGGKSYDIEYRGVANPLGTVFLEPDYFEDVVPLAKAYGVEDLVEIPSIGLWETNNGNDGATPSDTWTNEILTNITGSTSTKDNIEFLANTLLNYIKYVNQF